MKIEQMKDRILEISSVARRIYGVKIALNEGRSDTARWFLSNHEKLKYGMELKPGGLVLDFGSYRGEYTEKILSENPSLFFHLYEPIPDYFNYCLNRFKDRGNVTVYQKAVSADGRSFPMQIDGLRSRQAHENSTDNNLISSISIQELFDSVMEIELLKMNIEGMEYECLEQLVHSDSLIKAKYLLIQFHDVDSESHDRRDALRDKIENGFNNIYTFDWVWELWARKNK